nr:hypothetical protein [uncultured Parasphingorhabdus sp.]
MGATVATLLLPSPFFEPVHAQTPAPASVQSVQACLSDAHRAFDFWIGVWDVTAAGQDRATASSRISRDHGGCVIREDYTNKSGYTGMSMSFYDAAQKKWHQTWMGTDGSALFIEGGLNAEGEMVLSNRNTPYYARGMVINRITWTARDDGSVRQHWQTSTDDGASWSTLFDGLYVRQVPQPAP